MDESINDQEVEKEPVQDAPDLKEKADAALAELSKKVESLAQRVRLVYSMSVLDQYKLLSKKTRNSLTVGMLNDARDVEELAKVAFRTLKRIKRERVHEDTIDELLGVPRAMIQANVPDTDTEE